MPNASSEKLLHAFDHAFCVLRAIKIGNAIRRPYFTTINSRDSFSDMPYRVIPETTVHVFQHAARDIVWHVFSRPKCCSRCKSKIDVLRRPRHVPIRTVDEVCLRCFGQLPLHSIMIMTETRAHNSAYLRVLSRVCYYPLLDGPDDDWWKVGLFDLSWYDGGGSGVREWKSGVDRNYGASAATSVASSGGITSSRTTISPVSNSLSP